MSFNWLELVDGINHSNVHVATTVASLGIMGFVGLGARIALGSGEKSITPAKKFGLKGLFEFITESIANLTVLIVGEKGRSYTPLFASLFLFILVNNIIGLVPGMTPATENINLGFGVGIAAFIAYNLFGIKEHGLSYFKHFLGPVWWLAWLILPVELISHFVRPLTLGLRLMANMQGDHMVLGSFLSLVPVVAPLYLMGLFVCFMQAFIFTTLTMVYVSLAISHDH